MSFFDYNSLCLILERDLHDRCLNCFSRAVPLFLHQSPTITHNDHRHLTIYYILFLCVCFPTSCDSCINDRKLTWSVPLILSIFVPGLFYFLFFFSPLVSTVLVLFSSLCP
ncbi:hypothetical protein BJX61DRAFT_268944 [Aspergillus egyptiacus]|nr:hypothetical protein BJX61DRAFT_268944 [Aspergillus egyptiacus]